MHLFVVDCVHRIITNYIFYDEILAGSLKIALQHLLLAKRLLIEFSIELKKVNRLIRQMAAWPMTFYC